MNKAKIDKINQVLADYFEKNKGVKRVPALDMMDYFVAAGIFIWTMTGQDCQFAKC